MKKVLSVLLAVIMMISLFAGCGGSSPAPDTSAPAEAVPSDEGSEAPASGDRIKIGVSIWSYTDALGQDVFNFLNHTAEALDFDIEFAAHGFDTEETVSSVENLIASGCDAVIVCNSSDGVMPKLINTCNENGVYLAQFFRVISDEEIAAQALASDYYVGCTHEAEVDNGYNLGKILIEEKGARHIGWTAWRVGDTTSLARQEGYKKAVDEWNANNPDDQVELYPLVDDKYTSEEARAAVEGMIDTYPDMDAIIVVGGGGMALDGTLAAIDGRNKTGEYYVVSTDFTTNLGEQLANNEISAMAGGHYADPLFSFMMVYNTICGNYTRPADSWLEVNFPYLYVASTDDYKTYETYFVNELPYNTEELKAMAGQSFEELQQTAASLSIEDVAERHGQ